MHKKINHKKIKEHASMLLDLLIKYENDTQVKIVLEGLSPLLNAILEGKKKLPIDRTPYSYHFTEGNLRNYQDLAKSYSLFSLLAEGYDLDEAERFFNKLDNDPEYREQMRTSKLTRSEKRKTFCLNLQHKIKKLLTRTKK
jgi:hypothetical protein